MAGKQILVFDKAGSLIKTIKSRQVALGSPQGLAVTDDGSVWVADGGNYNVKLISPTGETGKVFDGGPKQALSMAKGLAVDSKGRIYVADTLANLVRVFDEDGNSLAGFTAEPEEKTNFNMPVGIFIDDDDKIYIADQGNNRIQVWGY
nr:NHL repeat-containing protein [Phosphitispora fastidiosa]